MTRLLLIGTGVMGSSFALAARQAGLFAQVWGYDIDLTAASRAVSLGIIDRAVDSLEDGVRAVDAVLVAVPPAQIVDSTVSVIEALRGRGQLEIPVFDLGSVKRSVVAGVRSRFATMPRAFVPCHPMAGSEAQGPEAASADLFVGRRVFLTPVAATSETCIERVSFWWRACGATIVVTSADEHDAAVALSSHLPHLLAFAYMAGVAERGRGVLEFAGPGFRDFTRIAGSDPVLWRQILTDNKAPVGAELDRLIDRLVGLRKDLEAGRAEAIESVLARGRAAQEWYRDGDR